MPSRPITLILSLICLFSITYSYADTVGADSLQVSGPKYALYEVKRSQGTHRVTIAATVAANQSAQLTAQVPGRVLSITGKEGEQFSKGSPLIKLDDNALKARLDAAYAQRESALAAIRNARVQLHREVNSPQSSSTASAPGGMGMPSMMDYMFVSPMQNTMGMRDRGMERTSDIISRETQVANANTSLKQADAQIKEIQASIRDSVSIAPFDGVVEKVFVETGDTVQPGMPLIVFTATSGYKVEAHVPQRLAANLTQNMPIAVRLDGKGEHFMAPISRIFPVANAQDHTIKIEIALTQMSNLTAGMYAEIAIEDKTVSSRPQLIIPNTAIINKSGLHLVHVVADDGKNRMRIIRVGDDLGNGYSSVLSGIQENDRIIANPSPGLKSGTQISAATLSM